jgi:predicted GNAT family acetyltransferase
VVSEARTIKVMAMPTEPRVTDSPQASRFELWLGTTRAGFIQYRAEPGTVLLVHTEIDPAFEGHGLGERLVAGALADLRARGLKLVPLCPFVRAYLRRHPDQAVLVAGDPAAPPVIMLSVAPVRRQAFGSDGRGGLLMR